MATHPLACRFKEVKLATRGESLQPVYVHICIFAAVAAARGPGRAQPRGSQPAKLGLATGAAITAVPGTVTTAVTLHALDTLQLALQIMIGPYCCPLYCCFIPLALEARVIARISARFSRAQSLCLHSFFPASMKI